MQTNCAPGTATKARRSEEDQLVLVEYLVELVCDLLLNPANYVSNSAGFERFLKEFGGSADGPPTRQTNTTIEQANVAAAPKNSKPVNAQLFGHVVVIHVFSLGLTPHMKRTPLII